MARIPFYYCHGSAYFFRILNVPLGIDLNFRATGGGDRWYEVAGLNGQTYGWSGFPGEDPFPDMLDSTVWEPVRITYPAAFFPMSLSIDQGRDAVLAKINALPAGTPFALGGYSQGAAVMVHVWNALSPARRADMLGATMFGNPRRTVNWRGPVGGTWSGAMYQPGTTGGGGSFPATGPYARMVNPPANWADFAAPNDPITSVNSAIWNNLNNDLLTLSVADAAQFLGLLVESLLLAPLGIPPSDLAQALEDYFLGPIPNQLNYFVDGANNLIEYAGNGHTTYPFLPPPNADGTFTTTSVVSGGNTYLKPAAPTAYQVALAYLEGLAGRWSNTPVIVPEQPPSTPAWGTQLTLSGSLASGPGWSTTL